MVNMEELLNIESIYSTRGFIVQKLLSAYFMKKVLLGLLIKLEELLDDHDLSSHLVCHLSKVTTLHYQNDTFTEASV